MSYQHDIFLSYQRDPETLCWIKLHLVPILKVHLRHELGRDPDIFIDDQIESGTSWPVELATNLATSRILIPLWTKTYFFSRWCSKELSNMLGREKATSRRTRDNPRGLVVPAVIHDCIELPSKFADITPFRIIDCFNVRMSKDSPRAEELDNILSKEAESIAKSIDNAPVWQADWPDKYVSEFYDEYRDKQAPVQKSIPGFAKT